MKQGMTSLQAFAVEIERRAKAKKDFVASTSKCELVPVDSGIAMRLGDQTFGINNTGHSQIAETVDIPKMYYNRMLKEQPAMLANDVNVWFRANPQQRLIRTLDGAVRAVRSDRFRTDLEYEDLAEAVLPVLMELDVAIMSFQLTETRMYIKAVDKKVERELAKVGSKFGDGKHTILRVASPAVTISDSEVGFGSASVMAGVYDGFCSNLATFGERSLRKYHVGAKHEMLAGTDYTLLSDDTKRKTAVANIAQIKDVVAAAFNRAQFDALCDKIEDTAKDKIEGDVVKTVEMTTRRLGMSDEDGKGILACLIEGGELSRYGLYNAITLQSQKVEDYDKATAMERMGAQLIELPRKEWQAMAKAA